MKIKIPVNYRITIYDGKVHKKPHPIEKFPKDWYYDKPTRIHEIIQEEIKENKLLEKRLKWYSSIINKRIQK